MYVLYGGRFTRALLVKIVRTEGGIDHELREGILEWTVLPDR